MYIECIRNEGFEDQLTHGASYRILALGENSYLIENDKEQSRWYGRHFFRVRINEEAQAA